MKKLKGVFLIVCALMFSQSVFAQLSITPSNDTTVLKNALLGSDPDSRITITNIQFQGAPTAAGTYINGPLGIADGIILASGDVTNALPPNDSGSETTAFVLPGCPECDSLIPGYTSYDAATLTITFDVGAIDGIRFDFIFGSEEYPEYVGSKFNDVFGAYVNGTTQIAFDQDSNPITINGPWFSGGSVIVPPANGMEYDGSTTLLTAAGVLLPNSKGNTVKFFICDAGDYILDSGVLLSKLRGCVGDDCSGPVKPPTIQLSPAFAQNLVGTQHTLTAKVTAPDATPIVGATVTFTVTAGPNAGKSGSATTDANGESIFSYTSTSLGIDTIQATVVIGNVEFKSESAQKEWISNPACTDADQDGYAVEGGDCGPVDCDDSNPAINLGAEEVCGDGIDNNCNGETDEGCQIIVNVDIKPGSCPNPINLKDQGVMPFAIMGTVEFDVTQIDPASIRLSREGVPGEVAPIRWSYEDVATPFEGELCNCHTLKGDGIMDLALKVDAQAVIKTLKLAEVIGQTIPLTMTGKLKDEFGGTPITGKDCIRMLKK